MPSTTVPRTQPLVVQPTTIRVSAPAATSCDDKVRAKEDGGESLVDDDVVRLRGERFDDLRASAAREVVVGGQGRDFVRVSRAFLHAGSLALRVHDGPAP